MTSIHDLKLASETLEALNFLLQNTVDLEKAISSVDLTELKKLSHDGGQFKERIEKLVAEIQNDKSSIEGIKRDIETKADTTRDKIAEFNNMASRLEAKYAELAELQASLKNLEKDITGLLSSGLINDTIESTTQTFSSKKITKLLADKSGELDGSQYRKIDDSYDKAQIDGKIDNLIGSAPVELNTLEKLAAALNNDADFATTISKKTNGKLGKTEKAADSDKLDGLDSSAFAKAEQVLIKRGLPKGDYRSVGFWRTVEAGWYSYNHDSIQGSNNPSAYGVIHVLKDGNDFNILWYRKGTAEIYRAGFGGSQAGNSTIGWNIVATSLTVGSYPDTAVLRDSSGDFNGRNITATQFKMSAPKEDTLLTSTSEILFRQNNQDDSNQIRAASLSKLLEFGGGAEKGFGVNQTIQTMTGSKRAGELYTNTSSKPIFVIIQATLGASSGSTFTASLDVDGVSIAKTAFATVGFGTTSTLTGFVFPNAKYKLTLGGSAQLSQWYEIR